MSTFKKKMAGQCNILTDRYIPASLPTYGQGLENFVTSDYSMTKAEVIKGIYHDTETELEHVIDTCDKYSAGSECDRYIDAEIEHATAIHEAEIADHDNQVIRIRSAREMRKATLERMIAPINKRAERLEAEIAPLEDLHSQFQLHIGHRTISIGLPITIVAMIIDAAVNYSFFQTILLSNAFLLMLTVISMSVMSDLTMWGLGTFLSRRDEEFISKPLYYAICVGLLLMFFLSVVASIMVRWGSMDVTYGTINAAGEFVGKASYSLAEYGVTLVTAFLTTATGILSFAFSLDKNAFLVSIRERKKKELANCVAELAPLINELALIENAPDPQERDNRKRTAAERQIEALHVGLKLHCRKLMTVRINDPDFTEKMAASGENLTANASTDCVSNLSDSKINLTKVS